MYDRMVLFVFRAGKRFGIGVGEAGGCVVVVLQLGGLGAQVKGSVACLAPSLVAGECPLFRRRSPVNPSPLPPTLRVSVRRHRRTVGRNSLRARRAVVSNARRSPQACSKPFVLCFVWKLFSKITATTKCESRPIIVYFSTATRD